MNMHNQETSWQKHIRERRDVRLASIQNNEELKSTSSSQSNNVSIPLHDDNKHQIIMSFTDRPTVSSAYATSPNIVDLTKRGMKYRLEQLDQMSKRPKNGKEKMAFGLLQSSVSAIFMGIICVSFFGNTLLGIILGMIIFLHGLLLYGTSIGDHKWLGVLLRALPGSMILGVLAYIMVSPKIGLMVGFGLWGFQTIALSLGWMKNPITINLSKGSSSSSSNRSGGGGRSGGSGASGGW